MVFPHHLPENPPMTSIAATLQSAYSTARARQPSTPEATFLLPPAPQPGPAKPAEAAPVLPGASLVATQFVANTDPLTADYEAWRASLPKADLPQEYFEELDATRSTYLDVLHRAREKGGLEDPQAFLKSLTTQELAALQRHVSLADPIQPEKISFEGAYNLLQLPNASKDINRDGLLTTGIGNSITFPPADAPQAVLDAWNKATAGMDWGTKMTMQLSMWLQAQGSLDVKEGSTARYYADDFNWQDFARSLVESAIENRKYQTTDIQKEYGARMFKGYEDFLKYLLG
ncbi:MAG: hypothetical protein EBV03_06705 [Proteobacteria bacterium]|nr:hypothetical protein [Pseudomonadota bacterium]